MVVKVSKRQSMNGSGLWEVEEIPNTPRNLGIKKRKLDTSLEQKNNVSQRSSISPSKNSSNPSKSGFSPSKNTNSPSKPDSGPQRNEGQQIQSSVSEAGQRTPRRRKQLSNVQLFVRQEDQQNKEQNTEQIKLEIKKEIKEEIKEQKHKNVAESTPLFQLLSWPPRDLLKLVARIEENSEDMLDEEYTVGFPKINWKKVAFDDHKPDECKTVWESLFEKAKSVRMVVDEAREHLLQKKLIDIKEKAFPVNEKSEDDSANTTQENEMKAEGEEEVSEDDNEDEDEDEDEDKEEEEEEENDDGDDDDDDDDDDDVEEEDEDEDEN